MSVIPSAFCSTCLLQVFIPHPPTTHHPSLDLWGPMEPLTPICQSHVSAVITFVCTYLCSPHPSPKSRIRVQRGWETRSPPLSLPPLAICLSPWLQGSAAVGKVKWMQGLCLDWQSKSVIVTYPDCCQIRILQSISFCMVNTFLSIVRW